ncbi:DUF3656 domain-containing U32 family peptidase [Carboxylicivirga sp. N1Y90]|uniref:peptidase U32 family protein n=1 Tax=Carboxylicivirga fragile TaxID=3417571 RepID=UPI003D3491BA|nr:DUF3656 domain-containing protein [Marinilabiliaceae bacterium N1Y90]
MNRKIELLAPAKNLECGVTAINHGADAVYIGGPGFGARKQAGNSVEDIEELIKHAHLFNSKVYIAINTVLYDKELKTAQELIHQMYQIGADAIIIQDMGLLEMELPPIPIHASTQTDNRTVEKVKFLEEVGFDQVVLARELSLNQINKISSKTNVPLEYFIHGALCVCYSGQCYMSAAINGRSANRGECAQPCRLKYSLKDKNGKLIYKDKHLLSLKDLNQTKNLEHIIDAGITSFKIEGRLKDKDYVANITAHYRQQLDQIIDKRSDLVKASSGRSISKFSPEPQKSFNRGFTHYYLNERSDKPWSIHTPKALGEKVGRITHIENKHFEIDTNLTLHNGDGLCFLNKKKQLSGFNINTVNGKQIVPNQMNGLSKGLELYRNHDISFQQEINKNQTVRKINIDLSLVETNKELTLNLCDSDGLISSNTLDISDAELAKDANKTLTQIEKQLSKFGNTPFEVNNLSIEFDNTWFVPMSQLNHLRRELCEQHISKRIRLYKRTERAISPNNIPFPTKKVDFKANITNQKAKEFYERHGVTLSDWGYEKSAPHSSIEVMSTKHCILYMEGKCLKEHPEAKGLLPLTLFNEKDSYHLAFDCQACEMKIIKA